MDFYDAHIHFLFKGSRDSIENIFDYLARIGLKGFDAFVMAEYPHDIETVLKMVPKAYHKDVSLKILDNQRNPFPLLKKSNQMKISFCLDARFIEKDIEKKTAMYREMGFEGLKLLYVPEEDEDLGIQGMGKAFGRSLKQSEMITSLLIENAAFHSMFITIHVDLRKYGDFIEDVVKRHPLTNFNIAHFGFSRRTIAPFLEKYDNCFTDVASLAPFMRKAPVVYKEFIKRYRDRILFGSDALFGRPEEPKMGSEFFMDYLDDQGLLMKIFKDNYLKFHNIESN
jgi:hypothetical protein